MKPCAFAWSAACVASSPLPTTVSLPLISANATHLFSYSLMISGKSESKSDSSIIGSLRLPIVKRGEYIGSYVVALRHLTLAAFLGEALRFSDDSFSARALPPLLAPTALRAYARGFFTGGWIFSVSPVVTSKVYITSD